MRSMSVLCFFFFNDPATTEIYTLSLHDALPIRPLSVAVVPSVATTTGFVGPARARSEEHTSELQPPYDIGCRLLLEKKKTQKHRSKTEIINIYIGRLLSYLICG